MDLYTCIDCDSGDMGIGEARYHMHTEGHVVEKIEDEDEDWEPDLETGAALIADWANTTNKMPF